MWESPTAGEGERTAIFALSLSLLFKKMHYKYMKELSVTSSSSFTILPAGTNEQAGLEVRVRDSLMAFYESFQNRKEFLQSVSVAAVSAEGDLSRAEFMERERLQPPQQVRLIDCQSTCLTEQVVLIDWHDQHVEFAAISHTYGMEVYEVFDCECTSKCFATSPRCSSKPCPRHHPDTDPHNRVVKDILCMCALLKEAGVDYAWHDGVCIAQHNDSEVEETIKHIGWIYGNARETIIFLHYVGTPMAPIRHDGDLESRWQTRVWTLQEAALSKRRRYCVRVGPELGDCQSMEELEAKIALWYRDDSSQVAVVEEEMYWKMLVQLYMVIVPIAPITRDPICRGKILKWLECIDEWLRILMHTCFRFPTVAGALEFCSVRDSKHEGDRVNSILALAGVKDFVAPKDSNIEVSVIEFFKRQGQQGLARAVFTANSFLSREDLNFSGKCHSWVPSLSNPLRTVYEHDLNDNIFYGSEAIEGQAKCSFVENSIEFKVLQDGNIELRGELACICVQFTARLDKIYAGTNVVNMEEQLHFDLPACTNDQKLVGLPHMDLTVGPFGFKASFAVTPAWHMGAVVVPQAGHGMGPVLLGRELQDGESFGAYMVLPLLALQHHRHDLFLDPPPKRLVWADWSMPALLLRGDLKQAYFYKIGCFHPSLFLKDILARQFIPYFTIFHKLVII